LASSQKSDRGSVKDLNLGGTPLASPAPSTPGSIISETPSRYGGGGGGGGGGDDGDGGGGGGGGGGGDDHGHDADDDMNPELDDAVIYGTTVNVNEAMSSFRRFLREFRLEEHEVDAMVVDGEPYYMRVLNQINESQIFNMNIDCTHLYNFTASVDDFEDTPDNRNARDRHPTRRLYVSLNAAAAVWRVCSLIDVVLLGVCLTPLVSI
jgi:hypothetical protein